MKSLDFKKFINKIVLISVLLLVSAFVLILIFDLKIYIVPLLTGWLISFINVFIGSLIITKAFEIPGKSFINKVLLSLVVRVFAIVVLVFGLIYFLKIDKISLAVVLFFFYTLFLIFEINYLSQNTEKKINSIYK